MLDRAGHGSTLPMWLPRPAVSSTGYRAPMSDQPPGPRFDLDRLVELGAYDPGAADAAEILEYLVWLDSEGFDVEELAATTTVEHFGAASASMYVRPGAVALDELGDLGMDPARLALLARASGVGNAIIERGRFTPGEVASLQIADSGAQMFSESEILYFAGVTGSAMARMADAVVSMFAIDVEAPTRHEERTRVEDGIRLKRAMSMLDALMETLEPLFRLHLSQAIDRLHVGADRAANEDAVRQAIGFVDVVGFTTLSEDLSFNDLGVLVRDFEARSHQAISECGARLVKTIGDEVMFAAVEPEPVARAARAVMRELGDRAGVEARGGMAFGDVMPRGGDYFGSVVNIAARLAEVAVRGELLATPELVEGIDGDLEFVSAGRRELKGFAEPVETLSMIV